ncbi:GAF and ANTAR domain-containing protein [Georgenia daeguensis]|uniref:GAF and ANTAR domain-containing protein n=1 Tax=Georgenia daeguensis TaxID=908355 RepID=A0ABP8EUE0_9MICO
MAESLPLAEELARAYAGASGLLLTDGAVRNALRLVTSVAAEAIPGTTGAGVTVRDGDARITVAATHPLVEQLDTVQYETGEGPCLTAWERHATVRVADLRREERWPRWGRAVRPTGVRSALSTALVAGDKAVGTLKIYSQRAAAYDDSSEHLLRMFAAQAATLVAHARGADDARRLSEDLRTAIRSRDLVATARGILMEREHLNEPDALALLVALARREHRDLQEVALGLVRSTARRQR